MERKVNVQFHMNRVLWLVAVVLSFGVGKAIGEQAPPAANKGAQVSAPDAIELAPWADDMKSRQLRIRKFTIEPGGVLGVHSHDDRPDVSYLVHGTLTELRTGGFVHERGSDTFHTAGKGVTHWVENRGTTTAVLIVADILKAQ
jgi:quercetin dioxygenase-like cupin family protein